jgi:hypothetical protein
VRSGVREQHCAAGISRGRWYTHAPLGYRMRPLSLSLSLPFSLSPPSPTVCIQRVSPYDILLFICVCAWVCARVYVRACRHEDLKFGDLKGKDLSKVLPFPPPQKKNSLSLPLFSSCLFLSLPISLPPSSFPFSLSLSLSLSLAAVRSMLRIKCKSH